MKVKKIGNCYDFTESLTDELLKCMNKMISELVIKNPQTDKELTDKQELLEIKYCLAAESLSMLIASFAVNACDDNLKESLGVVNSITITCNKMINDAINHKCKDMH